MNKLVIDIETRNTFAEAGSSEPRDLDISVVCAYDYVTDTYTSYTQETLNKLWPLVEKSDMLITFNGDHFDIPLLDKYYPGNLLAIKSLDLLREIKNSIGRRIKLDTIAAATLGKNKIAHGLEAITWWKEGKIDQIIKYCLEDVKITKEVYDYAMKHGELKYKDFGALGSTETNIKPIKLNTKDWEKKAEHAMTFTLPF